jgi:phage terminase large subunit GpA-like protein
MTTEIPETILLPPILNEDVPFCSEDERYAARILPIPMPSVWAEENFYLVEGAGYAATGRITLYPWQREPLNAIYYYNRVMLCGPVQTGKSLLAEMMVWYVVCNIPMHGMFLYAKKDTVEDVFQDRIVPTIKEVPCIRALWDGNEEHLTQSKIKLRNVILRVASAEVQSDIATFSAGLIYASEVCKYRTAQIDTKSNYDKIKLLRGRQEAYGIMGKKKEILESSPKFKGDTLHREMFTSGVTNLVPKFPCPTCGMYQQLLLEQIKEVPNANKEKDHDPERIRRDDAAYYECAHCGNTIQETKRIEIGERVVWAEKDEAVERDGTIKNQKPKRTAISFQWSRLVDYSFKFSECLARFFEAQRSGDPVKLVSFLNEDMGEFGEIYAEERSTSWLMSKIAQPPYKTADETIPAGVLVVLCGIDTQDKGFYFVLRGFGAGKSSWLLDCDWIPADMDNGKDPDVVFSAVRDRITRKKLDTADGRSLAITLGLIDRGGHKAAFVDHIARNLEWLVVGIGSTRALAPLCELGKNDIYWVNTENLSRIVDSDSQREDWYLPEDVPSEYLNQFVKQYDREEMDRHGNKKTKRIKGGNDHMRDCENYIQGCVQICGLNESLFDEVAMDELKQPEESAPPPQEQNNTFLAGIQERYRRRG